MTPNIGREQRDPAGQRQSGTSRPQDRVSMKTATEREREGTNSQDTKTMNMYRDNKQDKTDRHTDRLKLDRQGTDKPRLSKHRNFQVPQEIGIGESQTKRRRDLGETADRHNIHTRHNDKIRQDTRQETK